MKVLAVIKDNDIISLITWHSQKAFLEKESWIDKKFIIVCIASDLDLFESPYEHNFIKHSEYLKCRKNIQLRS